MLRLVLASHHKGGLLGVGLGVLCTCAVIGGCSSAPVGILDVGQIDYQGRVHTIQTLGRYTAAESQTLFSLAGDPDRYSVDTEYYLYRIVYPTQDVDGSSTLVSGLVAIPATRDIKGVVSWQHGTNTYRPNSISKPSIPEGLGVAALFASDRYIMVAPDYIGLGTSTRRHPYYHWPSTVSTVVDLLHIAELMLESIADRPDHDLYLAGFSQGGGATAAVQRSLEQDNPTGLRLSAAATISGAFNLSEISLPHAIESDNPFYLAALISAFSYAYDQPLDELVRDEYAGELMDLFDGTHDQDFILDHLPEHVDEFLTAQFMENYAAGIQEPRWFHEALALADTYDYAPRAPLRLLFGTTDNIVIPKEAKAAFTHMSDLGGNVELVEVGAFNHEQIALKALPSIQQWFDRHESEKR